jgi:hypothetical protein
MWAAGKAAFGLFRADVVLISPAGSFAQEAEGADLVCFEGVDLTEHLEAEYRAQNNRAVPKNQRKSVLQRCMQVRNRSQNGEDLGVGFPRSCCADFADRVCFEGVDLTEHLEAVYCASNN